MDLTYVDKFGIPLQLEWFRGTNTAPANLVAGSYVYASTKTLANFFAAGGFTNAVFSLTNAGTASGNITPDWQYAAGTNPYASFARILAPQKISTGSPYPSVTNILDFLTANPFTLNGDSVQGNYYYLGYQVSVARTSDPTTGIGEWLFTLAYDSNSLPSPIQPGRHRSHGRPAAIYEYHHLPDSQRDRGHQLYYGHKQRCHRRQYVFCDEQC